MLTPRVRRWGKGLAMLCALLCADTGLAQSEAPAIRALRTAPSEKFTVNAGVRDWGPSTITGQTVLAGGPTGSGGLFAINLLSGKLKWSYRPARINGSVSTPPAVSGDVVIAPFGAANPGAVIGVSLATGKELWRGPDPAVHAAVVTHDGLAYTLSKDGNFYALDAASGREVWRVAFTAKRAACASRPIVRDNTVYLTAGTDGTPGDPKSASDWLFALDARTGQERWRYRANVPDAFAAACLQQPVVTEDTVFASGESRLYAVDRSSGRERWPSAEVRQPVDGRNRLVQVHGLVDAGAVLVGLSSTALMAFDKGSGRIVWTLPGSYAESSPATAVAGRVLYFQGNPGGAPGAIDRGTLHALDLDTRNILWSFSRPTAQSNWPFGHVTPVDDGLWVDSYQALVKLQ